MNVRELVTVLKFKTDSASLKSAENAVNRIKTIMQRTKPLNLKVNTGNAQKSVNALTSKLNQLQQNKRVKINVDTSQIDKATQSLNRLSQAQVRASQAHFKGKAQGLAQGKAQGKAQNTAQAGGMGIVGGLKGAFVALGGMALVSEIKQTADAMMSLSSRIKLVTKDDAERLRVESALYNMSIKNRASLEDLGDLYYKTASTAKQFGASQEDVLKLTDIVSKSLIVGGADTAQQKATILQLSQALGSGVLQGDELRSLRENAPRLMQEIAKNMGTTMAGLKEMGAKGELTTERLMTAILQSGGAIESEFNRMTPTIGQSLTTLGNRWDKFILDVQNGSGIFGTIAEVILKGLDLIGEGIDFVSKEFGTATPEMMGMVQDFRDLWETMQPLIQALGKIFMNWVVPALKIFGKVAMSVLGMVAQLLQPVVDLLGKIADIIATISGGLPSILKGIDNFTKRAESGALQQYRNIMTENNQTNNITVASPADAGRALRESNTFFEASPVD